MKKKLTLRKVLVNLDAIITGVTLTLCVLIANLNVLMRYFLNHPLQWNDEVVTGLFVWTVFIGSAYAYRKHAHLGVDIAIKLLKPKSRAIVEDVVAVLELIVLIMITIISAQYVYNLIYVRGVYKPYVSDILRFPRWWIGLAVPVGFAWSTVYSIYFLLSDRLHLVKSGLLDDEDEDAHQVEGGNF